MRKARKGNFLLPPGNQGAAALAAQGCWGMQCLFEERKDLADWLLLMTAFILGIKQLRGAREE